MSVLGGNVDIVNDTITGNTAYTNAGGISVSSFGLSGYLPQVVHLSNNIIRENVATTGSGNHVYTEIRTDPGNMLTITYSDFHDLITRAGSYLTPTLHNNIDAAPLFVSTADPDPLKWVLRLQHGSPCIDAGDNAAAGIPATDLEGNPRVADGDGNGTAIVDMGAYEFSINKFIVDFDGDRKTDVALYRQSIGAWYIVPSSTGVYYFVGFGGDPSDVPVTSNRGSY